MRVATVASVERAGEPEPGHDEWFRAAVEAALDDPGPTIGHEEVMAEIRARLDARIAAAAKCPG